MENNLPEPFIDVYVTYLIKMHPDSNHKTKVKKRGFYNGILNHFSIPHEYSYFNGKLLPGGLDGKIIQIKDVIDWEYCKE